MHGLLLLPLWLLLRHAFLLWMGRLGLLRLGPVHVRPLLRRPERLWLWLGHGLRPLDIMPFLLNRTLRRLELVALILRWLLRLLRHGRMRSRHRRVRLLELYRVLRLRCRGMRRLWLLRGLGLQRLGLRMLLWLLGRLRLRMRQSLRHFGVHGLRRRQGHRSTAGHEGGDWPG